jgi:hypothetical protein
LLRYINPRYSQPACVMVDGAVTFTEVTTTWRPSPAWAYWLFEWHLFAALTFFIMAWLMIQLFRWLSHSTRSLDEAAMYPSGMLAPKSHIFRRRR